MKAKYIIEASNDQGCSISLGSASSITAAIDKARSNLGRGWMVTIYRDENDPEIGFSPYLLAEVKSWTIRK